MSTKSSRRSFIRSSLITGAATSMFSPALFADELPANTISIAPDENSLVFLFQGDYKKLF